MSGVQFRRFDDDTPMSPLPEEEVLGVNMVDADVSINKRDKAKSLLERNRKLAAEKIKGKVPSKEEAKKKAKEKVISVGEAVGELLSPDAILEAVADPSKAPGKVLDKLGEALTGRSIIPKNPQNLAIERSLKVNYDILIDHIKKIESRVNQCCKTQLHLQYSEFDSLFAQTKDEISKNKQGKYAEPTKASVSAAATSTRRKLHKRDIDHREGLIGDNEVGQVIRKYTDADNNAAIWKTVIDLCMILSKRVGSEMPDLLPSQQIVVEDLITLLSYSNDKPDILKLSTILKLMMGYYMYDPRINNIEYVEDNIHKGIDYGDSRLTAQLSGPYRTALADLFTMNGLKLGKGKGKGKGTFNQVFTSLLKEKDKDKQIKETSDIKILYDKGGVRMNQSKNKNKNKMTKKKKKKKKKNKMTKNKKKKKKTKNKKKKKTKMR